MQTHPQFIVQHSYGHTGVKRLCKRQRQIIVQQTQGQQAQAKPKLSKPSQPRLKLPTKRNDPPLLFNPKPLYQSKKQSPSDPKPSNLQTTQKRKKLDSKSKPGSHPPPKRPTIKIKHPQP